MYYTRKALTPAVTSEKLSGQFLGLIVMSN
jgi:hypothetical protein